jgi:TolB protein
MNIVDVPVEGGAERVLTPQRWTQLNRMTWLGDGSGLVFTGAAQQAEPNQVWFLSYPSGEARKITNDLNNYGTISISADSRVLVTVQEDIKTNIWIAPNGDKSRATEITSAASNSEGVRGLAWTPDGKIVFHSVVGGVEDIWIMDAEGKNRRQLTADEASDRRPAISTDGRYIVFGSERAGNLNIWRMDIDGRNPKQLTTRRGNVPQATAEWVVYQAGRSLWKMPVDGGEPVQLGERNMAGPSISPDGKLIACSFEPSGAITKIAVLPIEGGPPIKIFDAKLRLPAEIHWAPDGRNITYVSEDSGTSDIWSQPLEGGEPKKLTDFKAQEIFSFAWSADNKLIISHGIRFSDVFLIRNVNSDK